MGLRGSYIGSAPPDAFQPPEKIARYSDEKPKLDVSMLKTLFDS